LTCFALVLLLLVLLLLQLFDGQPLQLMIKDLASGDTMLHLTVWHRRMLQHTANKARTTSCDGGTTAAAAAASEDDVAAQDDCGLHNQL
jgi:hypothetical protein